KRVGNASVRVGLQPPHPFNFPVNPLCVNPTDCSLIHDRIVIFIPDGGVQPLDAGLGARFAEQQGHARSEEQTANESNGQKILQTYGTISRCVGLTTLRPNNRALRGYRDCGDPTAWPLAPAIWRRFFLGRCVMSDASKTTTHYRDLAKRYLRLA